MKYAIILCPDPAGKNIQRFLDAFGVPYHEVQTRSVFSEHVDTMIDADVFIFATTHTSSKGVETLAIHYPGNWNKADLGGKKKTLCRAPASLLKALYLEMKRLYPGNVTLEATHHGPALEKPVLFIEIGSSEEGWKNPAAGKVIAQALQNVVGKEGSYTALLGLGGGHYPHEFNKVLERTSYTISHVCPKHQLADLDEAMLQQAIEKTVEPVAFAVLDWKGMGTEKARVLALLKKVGLPYKKSTELR